MDKKRGKKAKQEEDTKTSKVFDDLESIGSVESGGDETERRSTPFSEEDPVIFK